jgi:hypothetical protein
MPLHSGEFPEMTGKQSSNPRASRFEYCVMEFSSTLAQRQFTILPLTAPSWGTKFNAHASDTFAKANR